MPIECWLKWNGSVLIPDQPRDKAKIGDAFEAGKLVRAALKLPRRKKHHRAFFGYIAAAFDNWPEGYDRFQPDNSEHLRAWLLKECGHRKVLHMFCQTMAQVEVARMYMEFIRQHGQYSFLDFKPRIRGATTEDNNGFDVEISVADSVAFDKLDQKRFAEVSQPAFDLVASIWGVDFAAWKSSEELN